MVTIRSDKSFAENAIKGSFSVNENKAMIYEIRRHYKDLIKLFNKSKSHLAWSQVKAHTGNHWNEKADEKAKDAADGKAQPSRDNFRNVTLVPTHELHMNSKEA